MSRYNPPTRVVTTERPFLAIVARADPDFERMKYREIEYEFSRRVFRANPYQRGAYNSYSNTYPVGQPYGGTDPLVTENKPLYSGVPTGSWA